MQIHPDIYSIPMIFLFTQRKGGSSLLLLTLPTQILSLVLIDFKAIRASRVSWTVKNHSPVKFTMKETTEEKRGERKDTNLFMTVCMHACMHACTQFQEREEKFQ